MPVADFHDVQFPPYISRNAKSGPQRQTDVVTLRSGAEQRNAVWANSRRKYNAGYGIKGVAEAQTILAFWEERRGRLYGFRWKDWFDFKSSPGDAAPTPLDQGLGTGDGATHAFQLVKTYGGAFAPWTRPIRKPVAGTVAVAVNDAAATGWSCDPTTGLVTFTAPPAAGAVLTAGYQFDVPVRFDTDYLEFDMTSFDYRAYPNIPIVELLL